MVKPKGRKKATHDLSFSMASCRSDDVLDHLAYGSGALAAIVLGDPGTKGVERLRAFHQLRVAARRDPSSAYNLGSYFHDPSEKRRPLRRRLALDLFERAALSGMDRLVDAGKPYASSLPAEHEMRDIASRALCNIGADVANSGSPALAVDYFKRALLLYPGNANAEVCLGNMAIYQHDATAIDPLDGVAAWERAGKIGDFCHESDKGCPCRANVTRVARQIEQNHGPDKAREWLLLRYARMPRKSGSSYMPLAVSPSEALRLTGKAWSTGAVQAARRARRVVGYPDCSVESPDSTPRRSGCSTARICADGRAIKPGLWRSPSRVTT